MLTPQEVAQRSFTKASFGGYNMAMVDDFLDEVTGDYETLFNENALLKQKMGVLTGKIQEYKSTEEAMRKTLLAAQQMSEQLIKETEAKCARMLADAQNQTSVRQRELAGAVEAEEHRLAAAQESLAEYRAKARELCLKQLEFLDGLEEITPPEPDPRSQSVEQTAEEIRANLERVIAEEDAATESVPEEEDPAPEKTEDAAPVVEESSLSLYEQLMARRKGESSSEDDAKEDRKPLEFGKDFTID